MPKIYKNNIVVFDLDDVLFNEFEYVRSAYWEISKKITPENPTVFFKQIMVKYFSDDKVIDWIFTQKEFPHSYSKEELLLFYREHQPDVILNNKTKHFLDQLQINSIPIGIITDGRSSTQRNKIKALGLDQYATDIIISEECGFCKPCENSYKYFMDKYNAAGYVYIGDNYNKDFIAPNTLGWETIALANNGLNVNTTWKNLTSNHYPKHIISNLSEIEIG